MWNLDIKRLHCSDARLHCFLLKVKNLKVMITISLLQGPRCKITVTFILGNYILQLNILRLGTAVVVQKLLKDWGLPTVLSRGVIRAQSKTRQIPIPFSLSPPPLPPISISFPFPYIPLFPLPPLPSLCPTSLFPPFSLPAICTVTTYQCARCFRRRRPFWIIVQFLSFHNTGI